MIADYGEEEVGVVGGEGKGWSLVVNRLVLFLLSSFFVLSLL